MVGPAAPGVQEWPVPNAVLVFESASTDHTAHIGASLGKLVRAGDLLALDGELGAGKTNLIRGIAEGMELDERAVSSPTFVIVNQYERRRDGAMALTPLVHADAYRLSGPDDLESIGWDAATGGGGGGSDAVVCVEWASRIAAALVPASAVARITMAPTGENTRRITLEAPPAWTLRPQWSALAALAATGPLRCPTCGKVVPPGAATAPFDSARCRDADLSRWFSGQYVVSREIRAEDEVEGDPG